ncbi:MAG: hypothetical protein J7530_12490 [Novosphingobium sp.]|nr:hypothetical protein [Novosphingobium sp.]
MNNPYHIKGPALLAVSGGRTSAKLFKKVLDAHGGALPANVHAVFCNTGKERHETLRFVHEMEVRWGQEIHWLEWRDRRKRTPVADRFEEVGYNSAARNGEPFKALVASKKAVPNAVQRWCTEHLKMQVCADFMEAQGYASWANVVGLRADEVRRVAKKVAQNEEGELPWKSVMPLFQAGVRKLDVRRFWFGQDKVDLTIPATSLPQGFDLGLEEWEGNCTKCFNKSKALLLWDVRRDPADALDWAAMEDFVGGTFTTEYSFHDLMREAERSPRLPLGDDFSEFDAECGIGGADISIRCGRKAA